MGTALVAGLLVVLLNLLRGELPSKLSTTGVEWPTVTAPDRQVQEQLIQALRSAEEAIRGLSTLAARPSASPEEKERLTEVQQSVEKMDAALDVAALGEAIADAIAELPEREKRVIALHYYGGLPLQGIADELGVSESKASQIHRSAVRHLREKLGPDTPASFRWG